MSTRLEQAWGSVVRHPREAATKVVKLTDVHFKLRDDLFVYAEISRMKLVPTGEFHPQHYYEFKDRIYEGKVILEVHGAKQSLGKFKFTIGAYDITTLEANPVIEAMFKHAGRYAHWKTGWPYPPA